MEVGSKEEVVAEVKLEVKVEVEVSGGEYTSGYVMTKQSAAAAAAAAAARRPRLDGRRTRAAEWTPPRTLRMPPCARRRQPSPLRSQ
jgi:hypothetical protein